MNREFFDNMKGQMNPSEKCVSELRGKIAKTPKTTPLLPRAARNVLAVAAAIGVFAGVTAVYFIQKQAKIETANPSAVYETGITHDEVERLLEGKRLLTEYANGCGITYDADISAEIHGETYYKLLDPNFDTWEKWHEYVNSVFTEDNAGLFPTEGNAISLINYNGELYTDGAMRDYASPEKYNYYIEENGANRAVIQQMYWLKEDVHFDEFELVNVGGVWKINAELPKYGDGNGERLVNFGGYKWYAIYADEYRALLTSETAFGDNFAAGEFYAGLTDEEKRVIDADRMTMQNSEGDEIFVSLWVKLTDTDEGSETTETTETAVTDIPAEVDALIRPFQVSDLPKVQYYVLESRPNLYLIREMYGNHIDQILYIDDVTIEYNGTNWEVTYVLSEIYRPGDYTGNCFIFNNVKWYVFHVNENDADLVLTYPDEAEKALNFAPAEKEKVLGVYKMYSGDLDDLSDDLLERFDYSTDFPSDYVPVVKISIGNVVTASETASVTTATELEEVGAAETVIVGGSDRTDPDEETFRVNCKNYAYTLCDVLTVNDADALTEIFGTQTEKYEYLLNRNYTTLTFDSYYFVYKQDELIQTICYFTAEYIGGDGEVIRENWESYVSRGGNNEAIPISITNIIQHEKYN